jgi:ankyrin repeat protein
MSLDVLPVHRAARYSTHVRVVQLLRSRELLPQKTNRGSLPLHLVSHNDQAPLDLVRFLAAEWEPALRVRDGDGYLPLHRAARYPAEPAVRLLAGMWEDSLKEKTTKEGWLPLHLAAGTDKVPVDGVRFLVVQCRPALKIKDAQGWLPLHRPARYSTKRVVRLLANLWPQALQLTSTFVPVTSTL